jgi:acyl-coenzyme A thioesterase PaaI-like protein
LSRQGRNERRKALRELLQKDPFLTDWQLAERLGVSVATIRLDRMALDIPELRERAKTIAADTYSAIRALRGEEVIGDLVELELGQKGSSVMEVTEAMVFAHNQILRGHFLFAQAYSLAVALVDSEDVQAEGAKVDYLRPVKLGDRVLAKAQVTAVQGDHYRVAVASYVQDELVFNGEFVVVDVADKGGANRA